MQKQSSVRMTEKVLSELRDAMTDAAVLWHRLLLIIGPCASGKSALLRALAVKEERPYLK
jgi:ABC-type polar amino acid transport system ATPase subunit